MRVLLCLALAYGAQVAPIFALPATTPPLSTENQKFLPIDRERGDLFCAVSVSGATAMIGAARGGTIVPNSGSVYVYELGPAGTWLPTAELSPNDATPGDQFGFAVTLDGDVAVVGAYGDNPWGDVSGSAYVFERGTAGGWQQVAKLIPDSGAPADAFGGAVSISGNQIVIGASGANPQGNNSGAAYVFERNAAGQWLQSAKLTASNGFENDNFGESVDISGDKIVVGAHLYFSGRQRLGAALVYEKSATGVWQETAILRSQDPTSPQSYAQTVSIHGDTVAVGAPRGLNSVGAVYLYEPNAANIWEEVQRIETINPRQFGDFGGRLDLSERRLLIGAEDHNLSNDWNGAAYVYSRGASGLWELDATLIGSGARDARFGSRVAVDDNSAFVGGYRYDFESGVAYYYNLAAQIPEPSGLLLAAVAAAAVWSRRRGRGR